MRSCYSGSNTNIYTFIDTTDIADFGIKKKKKKEKTFRIRILGNY